MPPSAFPRRLSHLKSRELLEQLRAVQGQLDHGGTHFAGGPVKVITQVIDLIFMGELMNDQIDDLRGDAVVKEDGAKVSSVEDQGFFIVRLHAHHNPMPDQSGFCCRVGDKYSLPSVEPKTFKV